MTRSVLARGVLVGVVLAGGALVGCAGDPPVALHWRRVSLPVAGPADPQVRALASCPGHWYAVGGYRSPAGGTAPAAWTSTDGSSWQSLPTRPSSVYGPSHLLSAAACRDDDGHPSGTDDPGGAGVTMVAVGASAGGVHGNPRTGTWISRAGGPLVETPAPFELYGGPDGIGVGRLAAGPAGFVIEGARVGPSGIAGAAVWAAPDGTEFRLVDGDPAIASGRSGGTVAQDIASTPNGFVLVGSVLPAGAPGTSRTALVATSADGMRWVREAAPGTGRDTEPQRVIRYRGGLLAVGVDGSGFGAWRRDTHGWHASGRFGGFAGTGLPLVTGLAVDGTGTGYAVLTDGRSYQLWRSADGADWQRLDLPVPVPAGGAHLVTIAGAGGRLLLAADGALFLR